MAKSPKDWYWRNWKKDDWRPLLRSARILRSVLETWGDLLSLKLQWKTISITQRRKIILIDFTVSVLKWKKLKRLKYTWILPETSNKSEGDTKCICLILWDEALLLFFSTLCELPYASLLLYSQRFGLGTLQPSSDTIYLNHGGIFFSFCFSRLFVCCFFFNGISTLDGYLEQDPIYSHDFLVNSLQLTFLKQTRAYLFHTVK